jgi:hypothetical protein
VRDGADVAELTGLLHGYGANHPEGTWFIARHRALARVEDRIRCGKDAGFGRFPSREYAINQAWLELALVGIDLTAWMRMLLLDGELALAEPKKLRYQLLHVATRITRSARQARLRINEPCPGRNTWPQPSIASPRCPGR